MLFMDLFFTQSFPGQHISHRGERLSDKAELLQVGIFFLVHLFAREILLLKKLEIEETKTP